MADRSFKPPLGSLEQDVVELFCSITVGASGAVTTSSGKGVTSVTKETAAGQYTILLSDRYNALLSGNITLLDTADSDPSTVAVSARIKSEQVNNATPKLVIQGYAFDDGAVANFASGAVILVHLKLRNSSVT